jgi:hypothetical protein
MTALRVTIADRSFEARLEVEKAPKTCAAFLRHMPFSGRIVHVRWSGEAVWIPLCDLDFGVRYENHTSTTLAGR